MCLGAELKGRGQSKEADAVLERAVAAYREAIRSRSDQVRARCNLGSALFQCGRLDEAVAEYREAIRLEPGNVRTHYRFGVALDDRGKHDEAAAEIREAIRLEPGDARAHYSLGLVLSHQGKSDEAVAEFREAIRLLVTQQCCTAGRDNHSDMDQTWSVNPAAIAGLRFTQRPLASLRASVRTGQQKLSQYRLRKVIAS